MTRQQAWWDWVRDDYTVKVSGGELVEKKRLPHRVPARPSVVGNHSTEGTVFLM
jgi:hypothetical protein